MQDRDFPAHDLADLGYEAVHHGDGGWNGVAILSAAGIAGVRIGFGDGADDEMGCRIVSAECGEIRVFSVYVPNGREVGSEFYYAKLEWLGSLQRMLAKEWDQREALAVCGDFNVAPDDRDVWNPAAFEGATHVTEPERDALGLLGRWGLVDLFRLHNKADGLFSWWDYRGGAFHKHQGMRIDLILGTAPLASWCTASIVDRQARKGPQPSDHAPVMVYLDPGRGGS